MKVKCISFFLLFSSLGISQNRSSTNTYIDTYPSQHELSLDQNRFRIISPRQSLNELSDIAYIKESYSGFVEYKGSYILLKISDKIYTLRIINEEKILNIDLPLLAKDTLYAISRRSNNMKIIGNWENRKKNGTWKYINTNNKKGNFEIEKIEIYKAGKLIETKIPSKNNHSQYIYRE